MEAEAATDGNAVQPAQTAARGRLVFWHEFARTYSYLAAWCLEQAAHPANVEVEWRPFLLGPIFARQGWADSPFNLYPAKGRYMWRDLERLCAREGRPWRRPSQFPRSGLLAARIALAGMSEGGGAAFSKAVFRTNFAEDRDIASSEILGEILCELGLPADVTMARVQTPEVKLRLRALTEEAERCGLFGAPSFQVGDEIFWGQDRLLQAVEWVKSRDSGPRVATRRAPGSDDRARSADASRPFGSVSQAATRFFLWRPARRAPRADDRQGPRLGQRATQPPPRSPTGEPCRCRPSPRPPRIDIMSGRTTSARTSAAAVRRLEEFCRFVGRESAGRGGREARFDLFAKLMS